MTWRASRASDLLRTALDGGESSGDPMGSLRRAALLADNEGDVITAARARRAIVSRAPWADAPYDLIAAFAWLRKCSRENPELVDPSSLLWQYKWVASGLMSLVAVPAASVDAIIDDLEREYANRGLDTSAAIQLRLHAGLVMKRRDRIPELYQTWSRNESGAGSDCAACRRNIRVSSFTSMAEHERAITEAGPILAGTLGCADIPEETYPYVIECFLRLGRLDEAREQCTQAITTLHARKIHFGFGIYLICLAVTGQLDAAFALISSWTRSALLTRNDRVRFEFFRGASLVCRAAPAASQDDVYLTLPPTFDGFEESGLYDARKLGARFEAEAEGLATRFDQRHGNEGYSELLTSDRALLNP